MEVVSLQYKLIISTMNLKDLLIKRFRKYNIPKYHKYAEGWVDNILTHSSAFNINYFIKESENYV